MGCKMFIKNDDCPALELEKDTKKAVSVSFLQRVRKGDHIFLRRVGMNLRSMANQ